MGVPRRVRTALVSREDSPALTQRRINRLLCGNQRYGLQLSSWMVDADGVSETTGVGVGLQSEQHDRAGDPRAS